ncbi:hypothetical protein BV25DRAFT_1818259 [Artomyces pyxidatus]|uniref:Uncharacterized protein n=1 Tax=Artomyces pyxidatus TaxID=48021 RepID=A0ACB8TLF2_9AGAM|nr:hypothetical protein BV25DRAFT_1818259 [Artomyces pyxidatus]
MFRFTAAFAVVLAASSVCVYALPAPSRVALAFTDSGEYGANACLGGLITALMDNGNHVNRELIRLAQHACNSESTLAAAFTKRSPQSDSSGHSGSDSSGGHDQTHVGTVSSTHTSGHSTHVSKRSSLNRSSKSGSDSSGGKDQTHVGTVSSTHTSGHSTHVSRQPDAGALVERAPQSNSSSNSGSDSSGGNGGEDSSSPSGGDSSGGSGGQTHVGGGGGTGTGTGGGGSTHVG